MGSIYRRKWKDKNTGEWVEGEVLWIKYYRHGKPYRESTHTDQITKAQRLLKKREGEIVEGKLPGIHFEKVTFDELAEDYLTDYRINGRKTLRAAIRNVETLEKTFGGMKIPNITTATVKEYIDKRMSEGVSNATINRELSGLKRMFNLASQCTPPKVSHVPYIPMLKESNTRKGFFEFEDFLRLKDALPDYLKPVATFAYHTGWRVGEILGLTWDRVDLKQGIVTLNPGDPKNEEARSIYPDEEVMAEIRMLYAKRNLGCPYVFNRDGKRIRGFRKAWATACIKAGLFDVLKDKDGNPVIFADSKGNEETVKVSSKIFHDFRRTAIRNMVRSGVSERVAMTLSGHKTRSVFERYNIVSDQDLKEAAKKMQTYHERLSKGVEIQEDKRGEVIPFKEAQNG